MANFGDDYAVRRHWELLDEKVYAGGRILRDADTSTFEILNYLYARDTLRVYYSFGTIKDADPSSFQLLDSVATFSGAGKFLLSFESYARDKNSVYHYAYTIGKPSVVRRADPLTFQSINGKFGRDERSAFIDHRRINRAQVKSWTLLQGLYSCDDDFCFYDNKRIEGVHRASFICLPSSSDTWAKDKHRYYSCGREQSVDQYLVEFEGMLKRLVVMKESLVFGRL